MRNYLKFPFVKAIVKEIAYKSLKNGKKRQNPPFFSKNQAVKNQFLRPNGIENASNMSQSVWNIIIDDQKHILDLIKSHKGRLKKSASPAHIKKNSHLFKKKRRKNVMISEFFMGGEALFKATLN